MSSPPLPPPRALDAARIFQALGDPTRRVIVEMLSERPQSVSRLAEPLGVTLTAVGQHLQVLEECGLVRTEKVGRIRTCQVDPAGLDALDGWTKARRHPLERRLDQLDALLDEDEA